MRLLNHLSEIVEAEAPELRRYRPCEVIAGFTLSMRRELNFSYECRSAERIAANLAACPEIVVPHIYWQWSGERLNVQDSSAGFPDVISPRWMLPAWIANCWPAEEQTPS